MPVAGDAVLYHCPPCGALWELTGDRLTERPMLHGAGADLSGMSPGEPFRRVAFWVFPFRAATAAGEVRTMADYFTLVGNPRQFTAGGGEKPPLVFVPAFALLPAQLLRAGRLLTIRGAAFRPGTGLPPRLAPVVFREEDARVLAETIVLATVTEERRLSPQFLDAFSVRTGPGRLLTVPLQALEGRFLLPELNLEF